MPCRLRVEKRVDESERIRIMKGEEITFALELANLRRDKDGLISEPREGSRFPLLIVFPRDIVRIGFKLEDSVELWKRRIERICGQSESVLSYPDYSITNEWIHVEVR